MVNTRSFMRLLVALSCLAATLAGGGQVAKDPFTSEFPIDKRELTSTGRNPYFVLEPGYQVTLEDAKDKERLVITVLNETKVVDGVETRIVEERETKDGKLVEVSRNFFAISKSDRSVYYFGEDVDMYKDGKVVSHEGAWQSGLKGAKFGLMMPGQPALKMKYYQEVAPGRRDGPRGNRQPHRDRESSGRRVQELPENGGDHAARTRGQGVQVLRARPRPGAGRRAEVGEGNSGGTKGSAFPGRTGPVILTGPSRRLGKVHM